MSKKVLMCGNEALGEAAIMAGLDAYFGYPITPQNEVPAYMSVRMPQEGRVFVQSESELAAINMIFGASAAGKRVMTSSSSPGISLMQEGISYLSAGELPCVIVNIMRAGPGLGDIRPSQSDYFQATRGGGHGDYRNIVLGPATVQELFDLTQLAFDLADLHRIPVMVLGDGILGQMMEPLSLEKKQFKRELPAKDWALTGIDYRDGNGSADKKANLVKTLHLAEGKLESVNLDLQEKYQRIEREEVLFEQGQVDDAEIVVASYGVMSRVVQAAVARARAEGIKAGWFRPITLWPFPMRELGALADGERQFLTVEMSYGQMLEDVKLAVNGRSEVHFFGRAGGAVPTKEEVLGKIKELKVKGCK